MTSTALATGSGRVLAEPPPLDLSATALFADIDGTLAPIRARPEDVGPDERREQLLERLSAALNGRLAVISGRGLSDIDRVLGGKVAPAAAVHGLVRRRADGEIVVAAASLPDEAREAFAALGRSNPALMIEDKGPAMALHYRAAPEAKAACENAAARLAERYDLRVQKGRMVVELRAQGPDKADAVHAFMAEPPFAGFRPVFLGDDLTDEGGFVAAAGYGGFGVVVGSRRPTAAAFALLDVEAALAWLAQAMGGAPNGPAE
jgi:trehalose 6-phosphate phosphatase